MKIYVIWLHFLVVEGQLGWGGGWGRWFGGRDALQTQDVDGARVGVGLDAQEGEELGELVVGGRAGQRWCSFLRRVVRTREWVGSGERSELGWGVAGRRARGLAEGFRAFENAGPAC